MHQAVAEIPKDLLPPADLPGVSPNMAANYDALVATGRQDLVAYLIDSKRPGVALPNEMSFCINPGDGNEPIVNACVWSLRKDDLGQSFAGQIYFPWMTWKHFEHGVSVRELKEWGVTMLLGIGLGHMLSFLLKKAHPGHKFIVLEPEPTLINLALQIHDFSDALRRYQIHFMPPDREAISRWFEQWQKQISVHKINYVIEPRERHLSPQHRDLFAHAQTYISTANCFQATMHTHHKAIMAQVLKNWRHLTSPRKAQRMSSLLERTKGMPAVLVAGGPTINKSIDFLRQVQGRALIITIAQNLNLFKKHGLKPDIVCAMDYHDDYQQLFEGHWDSGIPLVCKYALNHHCFERWQGPIYVLPGPRAEMVEELVDLPINKFAMNNISHLMYATAMRLELNPIVLVAHDLAITGHEYDDTQITDSKQYDKQIEMFHQHWSPAKDGGEVPTLIIYQAALAILQILAKLADNHGQKTYDATLAGAKIDNTIRITQEAVLKDVLAHPIVKPRLDGCEPAFDPEKVDKVRRRFLRSAEKLRQVLKNGDGYQGEKTKWFTAALKALLQFEVVESWVIDPMVAFRAVDGTKEGPTREQRQALIDGVRPDLPALIDHLEAIAASLKEA